MKPLPLLIACTLVACASRQQPPLPVDAARTERKAYIACAVRAAFSAPLPALHAAEAMARAAIAACEPERRAVVLRLTTDFPALAGSGNTVSNAASYVSQIDAALTTRLAFHLRESALQALTSGSGADI